MRESLDKKNRAAVPCLHLQKAVAEMARLGIPEQRRSVPFCGWGEWVFYECRLDPAKLAKRLKLAPCVEPMEIVERFWPVRCLQCSVCGSAVAGIFHDGDEDLPLAE